MTAFFSVFGAFVITKCVFLNHKAEAFHLPLVFLTALHNIDSRGFDAGVAQKVRQLCYILFLPIVGHGEQMSEIVRKHLLRVHMCGHAEAPQFPPDVGAVYGIAVLRDEYRSADSALFPAIGQ